jgi:predicted RNA-binding Zn-ribbon protein involved in translation (DUF1610 family)
MKIKMWIKNKRSKEICEGCGILLSPFYPASDEENEIFLCPECEEDEL